MRCHWRIYIRYCQLQNLTLPTTLLRVWLTALQLTVPTWLSYVLC
jgi:hypothetical protein